MKGNALLNYVLERIAQKVEERVEGKAYEYEVRVLLNLLRLVVS